MSCWLLLALAGRAYAALIVALNTLSFYDDVV
jgi:hypothetical protein